MNSEFLQKNTFDQQKIKSLSDQLKNFQYQEVVDFFNLEDFDQILKTNISLCSQCLSHIPAVVYTKNKQVFIDKKCLDCGREKAVLENDEDFYFLSNKDNTGKSYLKEKIYTIPPYQTGCCAGKSCGSSEVKSNSYYTDQMNNKTCTILVEITDACNLACKVCYADAKGDRVLPWETFREYIKNLINQKGVIDSIQLTGGEATLHPDFWKMMDFLFKLEKIKKIYLPTNGIYLSDYSFSKKLAPFRDKLIVLLQFDGADKETNQELRKSDPKNIRDRVIKNLSRLKITMQLTMTVAFDINHHEIGWVIGQGLKNKNIKVIAMQPVTYSGRYEQNADPLKRLTLSDIVKEIHHQANLPMNKEDMVPIPCSHPNCGWITVFVRRFGFLKNILKYINLDQSKENVAYKTLLSSREIRKEVNHQAKNIFHRFIKWIGSFLIRSEDTFTIAIKPFMDRFNYDQDRINNCCHHLMSTKGEVTSFCEYNALIRPNDSWNQFPLLEV